MTTATARIQVTSFHPAPFGGGVLLGRDPDNVGDVTLRARVGARALPREPVPGEVWRVTGRIEQHPVFDRKEQCQELADHIVADWAAPLAPNGAAIRRWIARNPRIRGVGIGYADRLWDALGPRLYEVLRQRDVDALAAILDVPKAHAIVDAFGFLVEEVNALEDLDGLGLDGRTASVAITLYGPGAGRKFRDNPYLMTILEPWPKVDAAALASGMLPMDRRRLLAAVDVAAAKAFQTSDHNLGGHTVVSRSHLVPKIRTMLGQPAADLANEAVTMAVDAGVLIDLGSDRYQAQAPWHMERQIEEAIADRLSRRRSTIDMAVVETVIAEIEREDGIRFEPEQREAVAMALTAGVSAITGGAGTGKSTIVKAIMRAARRVRGDGYIQVALSGRAAKRLREATGGDAMTIYRYLKEVQHGRLKLERGLLVIDEFSMVSTPDLWLILSASSPEIDVLLVGDPGQLPPIKAGNPARVITMSSSVPQVMLRVPHRQSGASDIPQVAHEIREGRLPQLPAFDFAAPDRPGVFLLPCPAVDVPANTIRTFSAMAGSAPRSPAEIKRLHDKDVQILAMTKKGPAGTVDLGDAIEAAWMDSHAGIHDWGFRVGSKILWTKNAYDHPTGRMAPDGEPELTDIMNGALGILKGVTLAGAIASFDDGTEAEIRRGDLERILRGWAITIHKAQGSAFRCVVIPVVRGRLLDRSMIYTAITRAKLTAVLVGEESVIAAAVAAPPMVWRRQQGLDIDAALDRRQAA